MQPDRSPELRTVAGMADQSDQQCLAARLACASECLRCGDTCADDPELEDCERACRDCFAACVVWLADLRDGGRLCVGTRLACLLAREACAAKCDLHQGARFGECAAACRACADACRQMGNELASSNPGTISRSHDVGPTVTPISITDATDKAQAEAGRLNAEKPTEPKTQ
jgi:hypothetical protein